MKYQKGYTITELLIVVWIVVLIVGGIGWVKNIITIVHSDFAHITGMLVIRIIGVFLAPIGAVLGYL